ncbi:MAG: DUF6602 domain-containing protein [Hyphomicrobiales bacterium]
MAHNKNSKKKTQKPPKKFSLAMAMEWLQGDLIHALTQGREKLPHPGAVGDNTELSWIEMLRSFLPQRYSIDSAFVVDVNGTVSDQIDVVIYDRQYTPRIFQREKNVYVPAESVYAVFEVKQEISKATIKYAAKKVASVRSLERTSGLIASAGGPLGRKTISPIVGGLLTLSSTWNEPFGVKLGEALADWGDDAHRLDLGCAAACGCFETAADGTLSDVWPKEGDALVWFVTRLMARLQPIATVPAIDIVRWADEALRPTPRK